MEVFVSVGDLYIEEVEVFQNETRGKYFVLLCLVSLCWRAWQWQGDGATRRNLRVVDSIFDTGRVTVVGMFVKELGYLVRKQIKTKEVCIFLWEMWSERNMRQ